MDLHSASNPSTTQSNHQARGRAIAPSPSPPRPPSLLPSTVSTTPSLPSSSSSSSSSTGPFELAHLRLLFDHTSEKARILRDALVATQAADTSNFLVDDISDATHVVVDPQSTYGEGLVRARASSSALASSFFPALVSLDWIEDSLRLKQQQKAIDYLYPFRHPISKESAVGSEGLNLKGRKRIVSYTEEETNDMRRFLRESQTVQEAGEKMSKRHPRGSSSSVGSSSNNNQSAVRDDLASDWFIGAVPEDEDLAQVGLRCFRTLDNIYKEFLDKPSTGSIADLLVPSSTSRIETTEDSSQHPLLVASESTSTRLPQPRPISPTASFPLELAHHLQPHRLPHSSHFSNLKPPVPSSSSLPLEPPSFLRFGVASSFASPSSSTCWACGSFHETPQLFTRLELAEPSWEDPLVLWRFARTIC
ncbi:hypothetical protein BDY24DRAFT_443372, partial [Mrakia frigida]|uniref:uncharacterized protein n=1 Tax=Mrakia frigida TaxID=29902 RepID=UPI003FCC1E3E